MSIRLSVPPNLESLVVKSRITLNILKCFFFLLRPSIANAVDIKACLKIAKLYDFIKPSMAKLSKNQNSWKYAKTITDVADRHIKSTVGSHLQ